jgi:transposase-like protein
MKTKKMIPSNDGKCPHCRSDFVMKTGSIGAEASSLPESPETKVFI